MKTLIYDIETTPILGYTWRSYKTDLIKVVQDWQMICFAYKWLGDKGKPTFVRPPKDDPWNDVEMVHLLWDLFDEADVIVGHNVDKFDIKKTNALFLRHGLTPPSPYRSVDTLKVSRQNFNHTSNRLDVLGEITGQGRKVQTEGYMKLFEGTMFDNSPKAWSLMKKYNLQDVVLTEKVYEKLRPWTKSSHPQSLENYDGCTKCGSNNLQKRGFQFSNSFKYQRFRCNDCGSWMRSRTPEKHTKPRFI